MIKQTTFSLALILACVVFTCPQISERDAGEVFALIPPEQRSKLIQRMDLFIELEKNKKWDESYKMISESFKENIQSGRPLRRGYPLEIYKKDKNIKIQKFTPQALSPVSNETVYAVRPVEEQNGHFFIEGCGKFRSGGVSKEVIIEAYWENGDWYFSVMQLLGFEGGSECSHKRKN